VRRREFIAGLGAAAAWPVVARAQQRAVIGVLGIGTAEGYALNIAAFMQGLKEGGFIEGQNVVIEQRWANYQYDRLPEMAADLVRRRVAVMLATGTSEALAAKAATTTIPIVFSMGGDPVALGAVASLNRPGANLTGIANLSADLLPKQLQLLRELVPNATLFGVLADPVFPSTPSLIEGLQAAARTLGTSRHADAGYPYTVISVRLSCNHRVHGCFKHNPFLAFGLPPRPDQRPLAVPP
jgi:putative ABC transport system substrate-binding protein